MFVYTYIVLYWTFSPFQEWQCFSVWIVLHAISGEKPRRRLILIFVSKIKLKKKNLTFQSGLSAFTAPHCFLHLCLGRASDRISRKVSHVRTQLALLLVAYDSLSDSRVDIATTFYIRNKYDLHFSMKYSHLEFHCNTVCKITSFKTFFFYFFNRGILPAIDIISPHPLVGVSNY